jgi:hypothetical protein
VPWVARRPDLVPLGAATAGWAAAFVPGLGHRGLTGGTGTTATSHLHHVLAITVMTLAAMSVLAVPLARSVAATSVWWRARRAVCLSFAAFTATWVAVGLALHVLVETATGVVGSPRRVAGAALIGFAVLQLHPRRRIEVQRCARPLPLRARGWNAEADCLQLGSLTALRCARVCALPMLAMVAVPESLLLMAGLTSASVAERVYGRRWPAGVAAALLVGSILAAVGVLGVR